MMFALLFYQEFNSAPVLSVLDMLVCVAHRECIALISTVTQSDKSSHLVHLLCSLQTSFLVWCCRCMEVKEVCSANIQQVLAQCEILSDFLLHFVPI